MYSLKEPGIPIENAKPADPGPLAAARYSCVYWIDHLCDSKPASWVNSVSGLQVAGVIDGFLKNKYLYWLEGLSLCKSIAKGVVSMARLKRLVEVWHAQLICMYIVHGLDTNAVSRYGMQTNCSSMSKTRSGSLCTIKGQSRVTLCKYMHVRCCLVRQRA
jgi:hypothetical protein